ncbi:hypothetical protein M758_8G130400, partial [Ceratodon purpureus]
KKTGHVVQHRGRGCPYSEEGLGPKRRTERTLLGRGQPCSLHTTSDTRTPTVEVQHSVDASLKWALVIPSTHQFTHLPTHTHSHTSHRPSTNITLTSQNTINTHTHTHTHHHHHHQHQHQRSHYKTDNSTL